jgi:hypothetical protein
VLLDTIHPPIHPSTHPPIELSIVLSCMSLAGIGSVALRCSRSWSARRRVYPHPRLLHLGRIYTRVSVSCCAATSKSIILYTRDDCPLCDGLKEKLSAVLDRAPFTGSALQGYAIEVRDIRTDPVWESKYGMEIPVMAVLQPDGSEAVIPRSSPRVTADRLERNIVDFLNK